MASRTISTKLAVEGESQYKSAITQINSTLSTLQSRLNLVKSEFSSNANSIEALTAKSEALNSIQKEQSEKVETLKSAYANAQSALSSYQAKSEELTSKLEANNSALDSLDDATKEAGEQWNKYAAELEEAEEKLKSLKNSTGDTSEEEAKLEQEIADTKAAMQKLNDETDGAAQSTGELMTENQQLNSELATNEKYTEAAQKATNNWEKQLNNAQIQLNSTNDEIKKNDQYLEEAEKSADGYATSIDEMGNEAEDAGNQSSDAFQSFATVLSALGIKEAIKEIAEALEECISTAAEFEEQMSTVEALSGAASDELDELSEKAKELGASTKYTASEVAEAFEYMALAGWDTEEMLEGVEGILNLAAASAMDLGEASDIVTDYLTAFGLEASDAAGFVDQITYAMSASNTTTEQLGEAYKSCAATAASMGYSVEDTTAVLMTMANAGVKGSEAGNALNTIMTRLATNTSGCVDELIALTDSMDGVEFSVYNTDGSMRDLSDILSDLAEIWPNLTDEQEAAVATAVAGTRQYSKLQTIMAGITDSTEDGASSFVTYKEALEDCGGTAEEMAETQLDNLNGKITIMDSAIDALKTTIGEQLSPILSDIVETLTGAVSGVNDAVSACPALTAVVTALAAALAVVAGVMVLITVTHIPALTTAISALFTVIESHPIGMLITAIAAATAAIVTFALVVEANTTTMVEEAEELIESIEEVREAYDELTTETLEEEANVSSMVDELKELAEQEEKSAAEKERMQYLVEALNEAAEDLNLTYDEETDTLSMTTAALEDYVNEAEEAERVAQYTEEYNALLDERETLLTELEEAQLAYNEAEAAYNEIMDSGDTSVKASIALGEYVTQMTEAKEAIELYSEELGILNTDISDLEVTINQAADSAEDATTNADTVLENAVDNMVTSLEELEESYQDAYSEALESIDGQMELWDEVSETVAKSTEDIMDALESQISYWEDYSSNLEDLNSRNIEGLSEFVAAIADGSTDSAAYIAGMAQMSDEELRELMETYSDLSDAQAQTADDVAEMATDYEAATAEIVDSTQEELEGLDFSDEAKESAKNTLEGYEEGLDSESGTLYSKMASIASNALSKFKSTLGINSPSTEFALVGGYSMEGYVKGISAMEQDVEESMEEMAANALAAFRENSSLADDVLTMPGLSLDALEGAAAVGGTSNVETNNNITITVYGAEGQDVNDLADAIINKINRRIERTEAVYG